MAKHNDLGHLGEQIAERYLLQKGHVILEKNYRFGKLEIDLISDNGELIVFTEVKTRSSRKYGNPELAVDEDKELAMINAADHYLRKHHLDLEVRFDIVAVVLGEQGLDLKHIEDAFCSTYL